MRILLFGQSGQLGGVLRKTLLKLPGVDLAVCDRQRCDFNNEKSLRSILDKESPHIVINAAAYTAVDKAEIEAENAMLCNAEAVRIIGECARKINAIVIHFSTDYVFDGTFSEPYTEECRPRPLNTYGQSKLLGELALAEETNRFIILRTSWVYGSHGHNFIKQILKLAKEREALGIVADQWGAPTSADLISQGVMKIIEKYSEFPESQFPFGMYHFCPAGETNWCEYARLIVSEALQSGEQLALIPESISAIKTEEYPTPAVRPKNSRLSTKKFQSAFSFVFPQWEEGVRHVVSELVQNKTN